MSIGTSVQVKATLNESIGRALKNTAGEKEMHLYDKNHEAENPLVSLHEKRTDRNGWTHLCKTY